MRKKQKDQIQESHVPRISIAEKAELFIHHANTAEHSIRENYGKGRIPPDWCGDGWSDEFAEAYNSIREDLRPFFREESHMGPLQSEYMWKPVTSECSVQAWMFLLNPADMAYGDPGYLESAEYQKIKTAALKLLNHILNPPLEMILTQTELDLINATTETPQTTQQIADQAIRSPEAARKYLPRLRERGFVQKGKNGYYRLD